MKKTKIILLLVVAGVFCLFFGTVAGMYIGIKYHVKNKVHPFIESTTIEESFEMFKKCIYLKSLQEGRLKKVMDLLSADIKLHLETGPLLDINELSDINRKIVERNRQEADQVLKDYQNFVMDETKGPDLHK